MNGAVCGNNIKRFANICQILSNDGGKIRKMFDSLVKIGYNVSCLRGQTRVAAL